MGTLKTATTFVLRIQRIHLHCNVQAKDDQNASLWTNLHRAMDIDSDLSWTGAKIVEF